MFEAASALDISRELYGYASPETLADHIMMTKVTRPVRAATLPTAAVSPPPFSNCPNPPKPLPTAHASHPLVTDNN